MYKKFLVLAAAGLISSAAFAQVTVSDPWIRATVPAQKTAGAFMQLRSPKATRLVDVQTPVAGRAEVHQMGMEGQTMRMQKVDGIDLPAGQTVKLGAGGYHVMLFDLKQQLKEGEQVPLTLTFSGADKKRESVTVQVPVKPLNYTAAH